MLDLIKKLNSRSKPYITEIIDDLNISRQTFKNKFTKLEEKEIINNFSINIHPTIQPNLKYVILEIKTNPKEPELVYELLKIRQMKLLDGIFGEFSLIALFIFKDSEEFEEGLKKIDKIMSESYFKKYQIIEVIKVFKTNGIELSNIRLEQKQLDANDRLILKVLQEEQGNKLISTYDISKLIKKRNKITISQSTIYNKIKNLEKTGVILNYSLNFCPRKIGYKGKYIIRIKPKNPSKYDELALRLEKKKCITDLFRIGTQYGLFAIVRVKEIEDYGKFIRDLYIDEIEDTFTNFVLDELIQYTNFVIF